MNCGLVEFIVGEWNRQAHWASGQKSAHPVLRWLKCWPFSDHNNLVTLVNGN